jgi:glycosyltransferase involved in cell wall biosynthesis
MTPPGRPVSASRLAREAPLDLVCLSHLRWNFVFQRPQHLMTACARDRRVLFFEEPVRDSAAARVVFEHHGGVAVATPHLPDGLDTLAEMHLLRTLLDGAMAAAGFSRFLLWYYTPMALGFSRHLQPAAVVYDCMDELSAFANAPRELANLETELLGRADLVFTGGQSLYEAKRHRHHSVHAFPSSVDVGHFAAARLAQRDPDDQATIPRPRIGFFGVIDERMDLALVEGISAARPGWQIVLVGPVAKIDPTALPRRPNVHLLGQRTYQQLPSYLAGWDVALLPFAQNDSTRYISPTKTPEYLAAGKPVVSTPIRDVVRPYGERGLVHIADGVDPFVAAIEAAIAEPPDARIAAADRFLQSMSWQGTWERMRQLMDAAARRRPTSSGQAESIPRRTREGPQPAL